MADEASGAAPSKRPRQVPQAGRTAVDPGAPPAPDPPGVRSAVRLGADDRVRCWWAGSAPEYIEYHDLEWGRPLHGDNALYERLCLEAFQSGLSWLTILRKRPAFRLAFDGFVIERVATYGDDDVQRLLAVAAIVRNRAKIDGAIHNAKVAADLEIGLDELLWSFRPAHPTRRPARLSAFA